MRFAFVTVLTAALVSPICMCGGCDKQVGQSSETTHNPITGNTTTTDKSTMQRPDGSTYQNTNQQSTH